MTATSTPSPSLPRFFFFTDTATTELYTLSLHDALPISWVDYSHAYMQRGWQRPCYWYDPGCTLWSWRWPVTAGDRKSTRLNSSHSQISYAVFCLKKKIKQRSPRRQLHAAEQALGQRGGR